QLIPFANFGDVANHVIERGNRSLDLALELSTICIASLRVFAQVFLERGVVLPLPKRGRIPHDDLSQANLVRGNQIVKDAKTLQPPSDLASRDSQHLREIRSRL